MTTPSERTPLAGHDAATTTRAVIEAAGTRVSEMASKILTSENIERVGQVATARMDEVSKIVVNGDMSIRVMALMGGVALAFFSASGILGNIFTLRWNMAIMEMYTLILALLMIFLESQVIKVPAKYTDALYKYCLFLKYIWGRGILYIIAGNLQFAQGGIINFLVGGWVMFVGVLFILVGRNAAKKLCNLKKNIYSEEHLKKAFERGDKSHNGYITLEEFGQLCDELDLELTKREKEAIFFHLDTKDDNQLSYEEFKVWWGNYDTSLSMV